MTRKTAADVSGMKLDQAARAGRAPSHVDTGAERSRVLLHMPRPVPGRQPPADADAPDTSTVNGRESASWELPLITGARLRERERELVLMRGVTGVPP